MMLNRVKIIVMYMLVSLLTCILLFGVELKAQNPGVYQGGPGGGMQQPGGGGMQPGGGGMQPGGGGMQQPGGGGMQQPGGGGMQQPGGGGMQQPGGGGMQPGGGGMQQSGGGGMQQSGGGGMQPGGGGSGMTGNNSQMIPGGNSQMMQGGNSQMMQGGNSQMMQGGNSQMMPGSNSQMMPGGGGQTGSMSPGVTGSNQRLELPELVLYIMALDEDQAYKLSPAQKAKVISYIRKARTTVKALDQNAKDMKKIFTKEQLEYVRSLRYVYLNDIDIEAEEVDPDEENGEPYVITVIATLKKDSKQPQSNLEKNSGSEVQKAE